MNSSMIYVTPNLDDQKRLRREFDDRRIVYGWNNKHKRNEVWYTPGNSRPYMIGVCVNVCHAIKILTDRSKNDKKRARDVLAEIDKHNEELTASIQDDAMAEIKTQLRQAASGRRFYT